MGVDPLHFPVVKVFIYDLFPAAVCCCARLPADRSEPVLRMRTMISAAINTTRIQVATYPAILGMRSIQPEKARIEQFDPHDCSNPPEEAVEKIDPAAQVERDLAVIPEDLSEYEFGKYAAHIFVGAAEESPDKENVPVRLVPVFVEERRSQGDGQTPLQC